MDGAYPYETRTGATRQGLGHIVARTSTPSGCSGQSTDRRGTSFVFPSLPVLPPETPAGFPPRTTADGSAVVYQADMSYGENLLYGLVPSFDVSSDTRTAI